jgi:hypothetical protein
VNNGAKGACGRRQQEDISGIDALSATDRAQCGRVTQRCTANSPVLWPKSLIESRCRSNSGSRLATMWQTCLYSRDWPVRFVNGRACLTTMRFWAMCAQHCVESMHVGRVSAGLLYLQHRHTIWLANGDARRCSTAYSPNSASLEGSGSSVAPAWLGTFSMTLGDFLQHGGVMVGPARGVRRSSAAECGWQARGGPQRVDQSEGTAIC